jgi:hypothetical protein
VHRVDKGQLSSVIDFPYITLNPEAIIGLSDATLLLVCRLIIYRCWWSCPGSQGTDKVSPIHILCRKLERLAARICNRRDAFLQLEAVNAESLWYTWMLTFHGSRLEPLVLGWSELHLPCQTFPKSPFEGCLAVGTYGKGEPPPNRCPAASRNIYLPQLE